MEKREQAVKKLERAILDAEAAIRFGTAEPTKRNERREWGLYPMIAVAGLGVRDPVHPLTRRAAADSPCHAPGQAGRPGR